MVMIIKHIFPLFYLYTLTCGDERGHRVKRIVGGVPAQEPPPDDPTIFTFFAGKAARIHGVKEFPHYVFRGIKYAYAPVGRDRFLRPREKLLNGVINATRYAPPCIQPRPGTNEVIGSEDCLALNIFTPELPTGTEGLPVVVWIHGGGFRYGSASQYGVRHLVGRRLVVVTIQYRLGSLGFLSSGTKQLPGNVALWDMALAVQWVRNYIGFFGGNPYKIVVMGHGSGASSALMVALSNVAKGITSGIIAMSGTAVSHWATDHTPQHTAQDVANQNGCPTVEVITMVKCLQSLPAASIITGDSNVEFERLNQFGYMGGLSGGLGSAPVTEGLNDGRSLPGLVQRKAIDDMDDGKNPKIPLLTGICKDETKRAVKGPLKDNFLQKFQKVPNFLQSDLIQNLRKQVPLQLNFNLTKIKEDFQKGMANLENVFEKLLHPNFDNYVKLKNKNPFAALDKIADVTSDALFSVPAFLTVNKWRNNGAPTFLYSFEHAGKNKKGNIFLKGLPLVGNGSHVDDSNDTVSHGDDLAYLFDAYDIEGNPLPDKQNLTEDDIKVRDIFTQMIADFAKDGAPKVNNVPVQPFSFKKNNFIKIKPQLTLADNFKFCEMALWCNLAERLRSTTCDFLEALDVSFKNMHNFVQGLMSQQNLTAENLVNEINKLKNLSSSGINIFGQANLSNLSPNKIFKDISNWKINMDNEIKNKTNNLIKDVFFNNKTQPNNIFGQNSINIFGNGNKANNNANLNIFGNGNKGNNNANLNIFGNGNKANNNANLNLFGNGNKANNIPNLNIFGIPNNKQENVTLVPTIWDMLKKNQNTPGVMSDNSLKDDNNNPNPGNPFNINSQLYSI